MKLTRRNLEVLAMARNIRPGETLFIKATSGSGRYHSGGSVKRMLERLADEGYLTEHPRKLTDKGEAALKAVGR